MRGFEHVRYNCHALFKCHALFSIVVLSDAKDLLCLERALPHMDRCATVAGLLYFAAAITVPVSLTGRNNSRCDGYFAEVSIETVAF